MLTYYKIIVLIFGRIHRGINNKIRSRRIIVVAFFHKLYWQAVVIVVVGRIIARVCHKIEVAEEEIVLILTTQVLLAIMD